MDGQFKNGTNWSVDDQGDIEIFHMNEQYPLYVELEDLEFMIKALSDWKEYQLESKVKEAALIAQKEYQDYIRLKEKFEKC